MASRQLPTKPAGDAAAPPRAGKGPTKGRTAPAVKRVKGLKAKPTGGAAKKRAPGSIRRGEKAGVTPALADQQPPPAPRKAGEGYVRLRVRVENGQMSVVDSHRVEGPLAQTTAFEGAYAYEVTDGDRLLHAGSIPDLGVFRSFAHPDGVLEQRRHHSYEMSTYEFHARVPAAALTRAALPNVTVVLYRVKEHPASRAPLARGLSAESLAVQRE